MDASLPSIAAAIEELSRLRVQEYEAVKHGLSPAVRVAIDSQMEHARAYIGVLAMQQATTPTKAAEPEAPFVRDRDP